MNIEKTLTKQFVYHLISFDKISTEYLSKIGLIKIINSDLYVYQSKSYRLLNWEIKPRIFFRIYKDKRKISISTHDKLIEGIDLIFKFATIKFDASIQILESQTVIDRSLTISLRRNGLIKIFPRDMVLKLLNEAIYLVGDRFDRKIIKGLNKIK